MRSARGQDPGLEVEIDDRDALRKDGGTEAQPTQIPRLTMTTPAGPDSRYQCHWLSVNRHSRKQDPGYGDVPVL